MADSLVIARRLRKSMTLPEIALWRELRRRALEGLKFRRQQPFGPYVLDFYCPSHRLAIEVDGWGHNQGDQPARDEQRDEWLAGQGVYVLRLRAEDVLYRSDDAMTAILGEARRLAPSVRFAASSPARGEHEKLRDFILPTRSVGRGTTEGGGGVRTAAETA